MAVTKYSYYSETVLDLLWEALLPCCSLLWWAVCAIVYASMHISTHPQYIFCFHSMYLHFYSRLELLLQKNPCREINFDYFVIQCELFFTPLTPYDSILDDPSACVRYDIIGNTHAGVTASWLVLVTRVFRGADLCVFHSHFYYGILLGWRYALQPIWPLLTSSPGELWTRLLCAAVVWAWKQGFRQVLQTVAQCTETAGAAHQGSVEMTSPDKCTFDSSPAPTPPPQAPDTCSASYRQHGQTGRGGRPRAAAVRSGRAVMLHQVGRRWGRRGEGSPCGLTHQRFLTGVRSASV